MCTAASLDHVLNTVGVVRHHQPKGTAVCTAKLSQFLAVRPVCCKILYFMSLLQLHLKNMSFAQQLQLAGIIHQVLYILCAFKKYDFLCIIFSTIFVLQVEAMDMAIL